jgi:hypothetical protein
MVGLGSQRVEHVVTLCMSKILNSEAKYRKLETIA